MTRCLKTKMPSDSGCGSPHPQNLFSHLRHLSDPIRFIVMILGLLAILARSTGSTYEGIIEMPDAVPSIAGPYSIVDFF